MTLLTNTSTTHKPKNLSLILIAMGVAVAMLYYGRLFFITLVVAITIGFLLDPFVELLMKLRLPRAVASFVVCAFGLLVLYLAGLGTYAQMSVLAEDLPTYSARINELADRVTARVERAEQTAYDLLIPKRLQEQAEQQQEEPEPAERRRRSAEPPMPPVIPEVRIREDRPLLTYVFDYFRSVYDVLLMASFVPFLVYFMLSWKDHVRRSYLQLFEGQDRHAAGRSWEGIADMARAYVLGNFALGVFLSLVSSVFFWAIKLPYFVLIGPLSGFLSLIPYIGLPLAMVPPFFVALSVYDRLTPFLIIAAVVGFLHLLALNLLYPKLVGARVHLNPLAVTVALMFFGMLWGGIGLVLAIPVAAGVKAVCDNVPDLQAYGNLLGD
ncbi:MAG: AI-2E family transporter [bacterium]|nr:AI-2E family transporter [bacterium]